MKTKLFELFLDRSIRLSLHCFVMDTKSFLVDFRCSFLDTIRFDLNCQECDKSNATIPLKFSPNLCYFGHKKKTEIRRCSIFLPHLVRLHPLKKEMSVIYKYNKKQATTTREIETTKAFYRWGINSICFHWY